MTEEDVKGAEIYFCIINATNKKKKSPSFEIFAANYDTNQEKTLWTQWAMDQASQPEATGSSLPLLIGKVRSFESSELMPTVVAAVLSPVHASSSSWREKKELLLRLD